MAEPLDLVNPLRHRCLHTEKEIGSALSEVDFRMADTSPEALGSSVLSRSLPKRPPSIATERRQSGVQFHRLISRSTRILALGFASWRGTFKAMRRRYAPRPTSFVRALRNDTRNAADRSALGWGQSLCLP
ncbi:MAG TPA: hypothetical protein VF911_18840 [Thermoanaerobaculia bacterium]